jgi:hypothetical protein
MMRYSVNIANQPSNVPTTEAQAFLMGIDELDDPAVSAHGVRLRKLSNVLKGQSSFGV